MSGMNLEMLLASQRFTQIYTTPIQWEAERLYPFDDNSWILLEGFHEYFVSNLCLYISASLSTLSFSFTHTHKLANINILRSHSPDPWGLPCVVLFVKFTVMLSLLIILCRACRPGTVGDDSSAAFSLCWTAQTCCSIATNTGEMFGAWSSMDICFSCEECIKIETYLQNQQ